jgi:hypothetical protein
MVCLDSRHGSLLSRIVAPVVGRVTYTRRSLLALRHAAGVKSCRPTAINELSAAGLLCYRGNRAGLRSRDRRMRASVYQQMPVIQPDRKSVV